MAQIKIGLTGVHGSGKTTKVKELEGIAKRTDRTVFVVEEVARSCPQPLGTIEAQEWIWYEQMSAEKYAMTQDVDMVICDRTVMDNLMYYNCILRDLPCSSETWKRGEACQRWGDLYRIAVAWMPTYSQIIRLPLNLERLQVEDPIRPKDVKYARRIDALFDQFVEPFVTK